MRSRRNLCLQLSLLRTATLVGLSDFWLLQWFIGHVLQLSCFKLSGNRELPRDDQEKMGRRSGGAQCLLSGVGSGFSTGERRLHLLSCC